MPASPPPSSARTARSSTTTFSITPIRISTSTGWCSRRSRTRSASGTSGAIPRATIRSGSRSEAYAVQETGRLTVAAAPELSTWAMMLAGFAGLGLAGCAARRATRRSTSAERSSSVGISGKGRLRAICWNFGSDPPTRTSICRTRSRRARGLFPERQPVRQRLGRANLCAKPTPRNQQPDVHRYQGGVRPSGRRGGRHSA